MDLQLSFLRPLPSPERRLPCAPGRVLSTVVWRGDLEEGVLLLLDPSMVGTASFTLHMAFRRLTSALTRPPFSFSFRRALFQEALSRLLHWPSQRAGQQDSRTEPCPRAVACKALWGPSSCFPIPLALLSVFSFIVLCVNHGNETGIFSITHTPFAKMYVSSR